jgi:hypothetical protein
MFAFETTPDDFLVILQQLRPTWPAAAQQAIADIGFDALDLIELEAVALSASTDLDEQTAAVYQVIKTQLYEEGILADMPTCILDVEKNVIQEAMAGVFSTTPEPSMTESYFVLLANNNSCYLTRKGVQLQPEYAGLEYTQVVDLVVARHLQLGTAAS